MGTRTINWTQLVAALRDDGYSKVTGTMIKEGNGKITGACSWGQVGLNLGVSAEEAYAAARIFHITLPNGKQTNLGSHIMTENDGTGKSLQQIALDLEQPGLKVKGGRRRVKFSATRKNYSAYSNYRGVTVPESYSI